jgi:integrase
MIEVDPLASLKLSDFMVAKPKPKPAAIRPDYAHEMMIGLQEQEWPAKALVSLMLLHGTRIGETRKAKWLDFDLVNNYWYLPVENVKTREALRLPLTETAKLFLSAYADFQKEKGCYGRHLFQSSKGENWSESKAGKVVRQVSCGDWQAHDVRKLARTQWADLGIDYHIAERLLNHKMSKLDQTYIHTSTEKSKREALNIYHDWLNEQGFKSMINHDNTKMLEN